MSELETDVKQPIKKKTQTLKVITFTLAGRDYGISVMQIQEIFPVTTFTPIPNALDFIRGSMNLRGNVIPLLDLGVLLNFYLPPKSKEPAENTEYEVVVVQFDGRSIGLIVDHITGVQNLTSSQIQRPEAIFQLQLAYVSGVVKIGNGSCMLLNMEKLLSSPQKTLFYNELGRAYETYYTEKGYTPTTEAQREHPEPHPSEEEAVEEEESAGGIAEELISASDVESQQEQAEPTELVGDSQPPSVSLSEDIVPEEVKKPAATKLSPELVKGLEELSSFYITELNRARILEILSSVSSHLFVVGSLASSDSQQKDLLNVFYSRFTGELWGDSVFDELREPFHEAFDQSSSITAVNFGAGHGYESYSLAVLLREFFPNSPIALHSIDSDLIAIGTSAQLLVAPGKVPRRYEPFMESSPQGLSFRSEIGNMILFDYTDAVNYEFEKPRSLYVVRDMLSFLPRENQVALLRSMMKTLVLGGILILGAGERIEEFEELADILPVFEYNESEYVPFYKKLQ